MLVGQYGQAPCAIPTPGSMNPAVVELKDGEQWRYTPPTGHDVAWISVGVGMVNAGGLVDTGQLAIFEESGQAIDFIAHGDTVFVLGSAAKHPHELVTGYYPVHTAKKRWHKAKRRSAVSAKCCAVKADSIKSHPQIPLPLKEKFQ